MGSTQRVPTAMLQVAVQVRILDQFIALPFLQVGARSHAAKTPHLERLLHRRGGCSCREVACRCLAVQAVDIDVWYRGWHSAHAESRVRDGGVDDGELPLLPLAQQKVVESSVVIVQSVLDSLQNGT